MAHRIVIADDNDLLRSIIAEILQDAGYSVVEARTGKEALWHLDSFSDFSLLITDLAMPDIEGIELITILKKSHPDLSIVAISGDFDGLHVARLLGVKGVLAKPFKQSAVLQTVESALSTKASSAAQ